MRSRFLVAAAAGGAAAAVTVVASGGGDPVTTDVEVLRRVDTVAVVESVNVDPGWSVDGGRTAAAMRLVLDDTRVLTVPAGTLVDAGPNPAPCTTFDVGRSCVLLADMLGEAVVWFALVPGDGPNRSTLDLPGLVDMLSDGDEGVLRNGWVLPLASPVRRDCGDVDTSHLRDFITRFPDAAARAVLDLAGDRVVRVECV